MATFRKFAAKRKHRNASAKDSNLDCMPMVTVSGITLLAGSKTARLELTHKEMLEVCRDLGKLCGMLEIQETQFLCKGQKRKEPLRYSANSRLQNLLGPYAPEGVKCFPAFVTRGPALDVWEQKKA